MPKTENLLQDKAQFFYDSMISLLSRVEEPLRDFVSAQKVILDKIFQVLTAEESLKFSSAYSRMIYIQNKLDLGKELENELHGFRRFVNTVSKDPEKEVSRPEYLLGIKTLADFINKVFLEPIPEILQKAFVRLGEMKYAYAYKETTGKLPFLRAFVLSVSERKENENGVKFYTLDCYDFDEEIEAFQLNIVDHSKNSFLYLGSRIWPNARINLYNVFKSETEENTFNTGFDTLIILEPDNLLNASELAACFQFKAGAPYDINYLVFLINKLVKSESSDKALKGIIIGEALDAMIHQPDMDFNEMFLQSKRKNALAAAKYGEKSMQAIQTSIVKDHWPNLFKFSKSKLNERKILEPTYISERYGLLGRLDVLTENTENENIRNIVELKSGSCPKFDTWPNNKFQTVAYHCLLKSTYGEKRTGSNSIFYSQGQDPNRAIVVGFNEESALLKVRNFLASILNKLKSNQAGPILKLLRFDDKRFNWPVYMESTLTTFSTAYSSAPELVRNYYERLIAFLVQELLSSKTGDNPNPERQQNGFASLWLDDEKIKSENNRIIFDAKRVELDEEESEIKFEFDPEIPHSFRQDDLVIIYPKTAEGYFPLDQAILKGIIVEIGEGRLSLKLRNRQADTHFLTHFDYWAFEPDFFETNYWSTIQSLFNLLAVDREKQHLLLGLKEPEMRAFEFSPLEGKHYGNQNEILEKALKAKDFYLIQGPPGTGKTSTILVNIVKQEKEKTENNIFVIAFTNRAVEEICNKLKLNNLDFSLISSRPHESAFHKQIGNIENADEWRKVLLSKRIYVSTLSTFKNYYKEVEYLTRDVLIVDEASQITEAGLIGVLPLFKKFILIGDHHQLPSVVTQNEMTCEIKDGELMDLGIKDLRQSIFERLFINSVNRGWHHACGQLNAHFRMHKDIAELIAPHYTFGLETSLPKQNNEDYMTLVKASDSAFKPVLEKSRTLFIASDYNYDSKRNDQEANRVKLLVEEIKKMYGVNFDASTVGVIAPWRVQVVNIRKKLGEEFKEVMVDTVERFQGSERKVIIVSLSINNALQLSSLHATNHDKTLDRKLLVALSRAEEQIIFLGYEPVLMKSPYYSELISTIRKRKGHITSEEIDAIISQEGTEPDDWKVLSGMFGWE